MNGGKHYKDVKTNRVNHYIAKSLHKPIVGIEGRPSGWKKEPHSQANLCDIAQEEVERFLQKKRRDLGFVPYMVTSREAYTSAQFPILRRLGFQRFGESATPEYLTTEIRGMGIRTYQGKQGSDDMRWQEGVHILFRALEKQEEFFKESINESFVMRDKFFTYLNRCRYFEIRTRTQERRKQIKDTLAFYESCKQTTEKPSPQTEEPTPITGDLFDPDPNV